MKSHRDAKSIVQDLNEIFNRRTERAMHKIQLNKNSKQSSEKNKQSKKKKQWTEQTVKS